MRNLLLSSLALFLSLSAIAQPPAAMQYQAVARDNAGDPLANTNVGVMMSILQNSTSGTVVYSETHVLVTNEFGLFTTMVGMGSVVSGDFAAIDWASGPYFLKVDLDPSGGTSYSHVGTSQLLSVPYALHAGTVSDKDDADPDPTNEIQSLSVAQTTSLVDLGISGSDTVRFFIEDDDPDPTNEIQSLSVAQTTSLVDLSISGSDTVRFFIEDDDPDPTNELQTISVAQTTALVDLMISGTNDTVRFFIGDDDPDPTNELQEMSITAILDGSVIGLTQYQLNLTGVDPITLPIEDYWNADFFLSDPPQVATVWSQFPVRVPSFEVENEATITTLTTQDLTVGSSTDGAVHIQADNIHFDGPLELEPGWFLNREGLALGGRTGGTEFTRILINKDGLQVSNDARWQTFDLNFQQGSMAINNISGSERMAFFNNAANAGDIATRGGNGNYNTRMTTNGNESNLGHILVYDADNGPQAGLFVNGAGMGVVYADITATPLPFQFDQEIVYVGLQGPEAAAYDRGSALLSKGRTFVPFSTHFKHVAASGDLTIQLTPKSSSSLGLAISEITADGFYVEELHQGTGNYEFFWEVKGKRRGHEDFKAIRPASERKFVPVPAVPKQ